MDQHVCSYGEANIYTSDMQSLEQGRWLTDAILDFAKEYILEGLDSATKEKITIVSPIFSQMLRFCNTPNDISSLCTDFGIIASKWTIFLLNNSVNFEKALSGTHWALLLYSPHDRKFSIFDSLNNDKSSRHVACQIAEAVGPVLGSSPDNLTSADSSEQQNSSDCGMYAIEHMSAIIEAVKSDTFPVVDVIAITPSYIAERRVYWKDIITVLAAKAEPTKTK